MEYSRYSVKLSNISTDSTLRVEESVPNVVKSHYVIVMNAHGMCVVVEILSIDVHLHKLTGRNLCKIQKHWGWFTDAHKDTNGKLNHQILPTMQSDSIMMSCNIEKERKLSSILN